MIEIDEEMRDNWIQYLKKTTDMQDDEIKVKIYNAIADVMRFARKNSAVQIIKLYVVFFPKDGLSVCFFSYNILILLFAPKTTRQGLHSCAIVHASHTHTSIHRIDKTVNVLK